MTGSVQSVISRRTFTFSSVGTSGNVEIPLVRALDVTDAKSIDLQVRLHSMTIGSGASVDITAYAISLTNEEPDTDFILSSARATIILNNSSSAPSLHLASLSSPFGTMIRVTIKGTQPGSAQTITVTVSIDLIVRDN